MLFSRSLIVCSVMASSGTTAYITVLMLLIAHTTLATYDPKLPSIIENFNVSNARPSGWINYLGSTSDQKLPSILPKDGGQFFNRRPRPCSNFVQSLNMAAETPMSAWMAAVWYPQRRIYRMSPEQSGWTRVWGPKPTSIWRLRAC